MVVVGASWGGLEALTCLVRTLPADFAIPVVVVQHRGRDSKTLLADLLQDRSELRVGEPDDKEPLLAGHVYVAPSDYHLLVDDDYLTLEMDAPVRYSRPSIDVTFSSAADTYGTRAIGVVLTGANADGSIGLRRIVDAGGTGIVQDPESAEMPVMPRAARLAVPEATVLPIEKIGPHLVSLAAAGAGARTT
ncbi:MAG TPA: chemotaxis protein CheB [Gemmatimonadaceae bacterium]|nr:chemotaxis protein CheB [Gemmatimonadaceae bacterium]